MKKVAAKVKEAVTPGRRHHEGVDPALQDPAYATTGAAAGDTGYAQERAAAGYEEGGGAAMGTPMGAGAAGGGGMPATAAGASMEPTTAGAGGAHAHGGMAGAAERAGERVLGAGEEVCGRQAFTQVEDRPIVKERVERVVEHRPVEKTFVTETRFVGERPVAMATGETSLGVTERVIEAAEPSPTCPAPGAPIVSRETGETVGRVGEAGLGEGGAARTL